MKLSIFTSMTNPEKRNDAWKEALQCYEDIADEVIVVGEKWPNEFKFNLIGETYQEGFEKSKGDWVIRMDLDYFFHEKDISNIRNILEANNNSPAVSFPQYQFFTPDRFHIKTVICIALNKKNFPNIIQNGGGDLCLPTLNNKRILPSNTPMAKIPIWQYDSVFRTKEIIAEDRARFARAWFREFNNWGDRGGGTPEEAFDAWFEMIGEKYKKHVLKCNIENHPKYIQNKLEKLEKNQFGYDAFGLKQHIKRNLYDYIKGYKEKYIDLKI